MTLSSSYGNEASRWTVECGERRRLNDCIVQLLGLGRVLRGVQVSLKRRTSAVAMSAEPSFMSAPIRMWVTLSTV